MRKTAISYDFAFGNTPVFGATDYPNGAPIYDRPLSVITYDGSGAKQTEADYGYDGGSLVSGGVSYPLHDTAYSTSMTVRGNATSKSEWVSTTGTSLTWNYTYDDTGQQRTMQDPASNTTTYAYGDDNTYLTQITYPSTNGVAHSVSFSYYLADGQLASSTDQNQKTTSYSYGQNGELLDRLTGISYPGGGSTTYSYSSICGKPATTQIALTGGSNYNETATFDGLCRITETALTSDPAGTDNTDTTCITEWAAFGRSRILIAAGRTQLTACAKPPMTAWAAPPP